MTDEKWHEYLLQKLSQIDEHLVEIKVEVAMLKGKAAVWGSISGLVAAGVLTFIFK
jgi:hypothetical protein